MSEIKRVESGGLNYVLYSDGAVRYSSDGCWQPWTEARLRVAEEVLGVARIEPKSVGDIEACIRRGWEV